MPWVRFDDQFPTNRTVDRLSNAAFRLHVMALCWSARHSHDGVVPTGGLADAAPQTRRRSSLATELVDAGLWERTHDGYKITNMKGRSYELGKD
ncbi:MAG: hypothetical protein ACRDMV_01135 [Streptosporangiales bacterium]